MTQCDQGISYWTIRRDDHMHQKVPAIRRRRNVFDEQLVQAIVGVAIGQREIQRALYLSAELPRFSFGLPA